MKLAQVNPKHLQEMMNWFVDQQQITNWAGPNFRYPFDQTSFIEDCKVDTINSHVLLSKDEQLVAFGQFYLRLDKCHLGRLVVNPDFRGQGIVDSLIEQLCKLGKKELNVKGCSLFVLANNLPAVTAYKKIGFKQSEYPKKLSLENCLYFIK